MTSMERLREEKVPFEEVKEAVGVEFSSVSGRAFAHRSLESLAELGNVK